MLSALSPRLRSALACTLALGALSGLGQAQLQTGHSVPGFYGLEVGVVPPLGIHYENSTVIYSASTQTDRDGNSTGSGSITTLANFNTLTYTSPWLLLGGNLVMRAQVPLATAAPNPYSTAAETAGLGLGDAFLQPISIYWEGKHHLINFGYGYWLDTGSFDAASQDNLGKGFRSHEASLGLTYYPSKKRDWHYSILGRYEVHESMSGKDLTPGDDIVVDWGIGKKLDERWSAGAVGYAVWQTSSEGGSEGNSGSGYYGTAAVGGEVSYLPEGWDGKIIARGYLEFGSFNRPEGQMLFVGLNFSL